MRRQDTQEMREEVVLAIVFSKLEWEGLTCDQKIKGGNGNWGEEVTTSEKKGYTLTNYIEMVQTSRVKLQKGRPTLDSGETRFRAENRIIDNRKEGIIVRITTTWLLLHDLLSCKMSSQSVLMNMLSYTTDFTSVLWRLHLQSDADSLIYSFNFPSPWLLFEGWDSEIRIYHQEGKQPE